MSESSEAYKSGVAVGMARQFNNLRDANLLKVESAPSTDVQQLKAEIAAVVERLQRAYAMRESPDVLDCISELRQLSAV
jgi:hypothetical protein